jgi:hypothetical protein
VRQEFAAELLRVGRVRMLAFPFECVGPERPFADPREWLCTHEFEDASRIEVRIIADQSGVSQIVGVARGLNAEESASFLGSTVAVLAVPEREREALTLWAPQHAETGGDRGGWQNERQPSGPLRQQSGHHDCHALI